MKFREIERARRKPEKSPHEKVGETNFGKLNNPEETSKEFGEMTFRKTEKARRNPRNPDM